VLEEHTASIFRFVLISQAVRCRDSEDHSSDLHHEIFERNANSEVPDCECVWHCGCHLSTQKKERNVFSSVVLQYEYQDQDAHRCCTPVEYPYYTCGLTPLPNLLMVSVAIVSAKQLRLDSYVWLS